MSVRTWKMPYAWDRRAVKRPAKLRFVGNHNWRALAERRRKLGLTTRGTKPKRRPGLRFSEETLMRDAFQVFVSRIDALASAINKTFDQLSPEAQARALELAQELSLVRKDLKA